MNPDGSQVVGYYHAAIRKEGSQTVVLAYDTREAPGGQRYVPPISKRGEPIGLFIPQHNTTIYAYAIGVDFSYEGYEYLVLIADDNYGQDRPVEGGEFAM